MANYYSMKRIKKINKRKIRRGERVRAKITGTAVRPRLSVFRSNRQIFAQLIDDVAGRTLASVSTKVLTQKNKISKTEVSAMAGQMLADAAKKMGIGAALFDKGQYQYHGRIKALAEAARKAGLKI